MSATSSSGSTSGSASGSTSSAPDVPRAVGRVLDLLEAVLDAGGLNLTAAATATGLTPTTALRHLRALEARGYLERGADGRFTAGPTILRIAAWAGEVEPIQRLIAVVRPHLDRLADVTGESTYLAIADRSVATYVASAESSRAIRHVGYVGQTLPLEATAVGAAVAEPGRAATRTGAVEPDVTAVSQVFATGTDLVAAVSVVGPSHRLDPTSIEPILAEVVASLEAELAPTERGVA